ncbi:MAG: type II toxin-antitoxin system RelE/ParE family toxin [Planctomycetota bacterium]
MKRVRFSLSAQADLGEIDDYTIERFGVQQAVRTARTFQETCVELAEFPGSSPLRPDLSPPGRPFRFRTVLSSFVIVYEADADSIRVARILHQARNLLRELAQNPGDH